MSNDASVSSMTSSTHYDSESGLEDGPEKEVESEATTAPLEPQQTKVCYYVDQENAPYVTFIEVPLSGLTLKDFKEKLPRTNYKFFNHRNVDGETEKTEVKGDEEILLPFQNNTVIMTCLTDLQATPIAPLPQDVIPLRRQSLAIPQPSFRASSSRFKPPPTNQFSRRRNSSLTKLHRYSNETEYESEVRPFSDDDSSIFTDFTSVSQQRKRYRHYRKRTNNKCRMYSPSIISTSFADASMSISTIEVTFDLRQGRLGLKVKVDEEDNSFSILVADVEEHTLAANDGRIKVGMMILEVNEIRLGNYSQTEAMNILKNAANAKGSSYIVSFTFAETERGRFNPQDETCMPIDTKTWVKQQQQQLMQRNLLAPINEEHRSPLLYNPAYLTAGGFPSSGVGSSVCSDSSCTGFGNTTQFYTAHPKRFRLEDKQMIAVAMASSDIGGLALNHKVAGKKAFASTEMVDWLRRNVHGLESSQSCQKFANKLVEDGYIALILNTNEFVVKTEGYYYFTDKLKNLATKNRNSLLLNQKPAMDETLHPKQKGFTAKLKRLLCVNSNSNHPVSRPTTQPSAVRNLYSNDENVMPLHHRPPPLQQYRSSYAQSKHPPTHIP